LQLRPSNVIIPTLIGAPVTANTIAQINYGNILTRNYSFGSVTGPDITFYLPGDPAIPSAPYSFTMARQGNFGTSPSDGANVGPRFLVSTGLVKNGSATVANGGMFTFMYDTGNTATLITEDAARALGIDPVNSTPVDCQTLGTVNGSVDMKGFIIDRFEMTTTDGMNRFVIHNPLVYVAPDLQNPQRPALPDNVGVLLGSNFFDPQAVRFDGPGNALRLFKALSAADVNEDGQVNCNDLAIIRASFGKRAGQAGFDPRADVNRDGIVNIYDLTFVSQRRLPARAASNIRPRAVVVRLKADTTVGGERCVYNPECAKPLDATSFARKATRRSAARRATSTTCRSPVSCTRGRFVRPFRPARSPASRSTSTRLASRSSTIATCPAATSSR
jgi:Dockerin type I domain/Aspartyl protease